MPSSAAPSERIDTPVDAVLAALVTALDSRDQCSSTHSHARVALARAVGARLGLSFDALCELERVAALHDVGKLGVPTEIVRKAGPLTADEWAVMRRHTAIGQRILKSVPELAWVAQAVLHGHERWDGHGYPERLAGEEIPLTSRIVFACASYEAMISERPYRPAMDRAEAVAELQAGAGSQFDPHVVQTLLAVLGEEAPQIRLAPRETREHAQALALGDIAAELGATDLFVFARRRRSCTHISRASVAAMAGLETSSLTGTRSRTCAARSQTVSRSASRCRASVASSGRTTRPARSSCRAPTRRSSCSEAPPKR